ncbi:MAG TPA: polysaccharide biosynthesis protein [Bacteroidales bacterium]|nr:polysaccharide biosynthesis protein [Bacteroidales bacterium]
MKYLNYNFYKQYLNQGQARSIKAKKNILALILRKGLGVVVSFLILPLLIEFLNPTRYGIWITLSTFIVWFNFLDIGLGNGLRNRFAEATALGKNKLARVYVSTSYAFIGIISILLLVAFLLASEYIDWNKVFNAPLDYKVELKAGVRIAFSFFCLQFFVKLINTILTADQKPALAGYFSTISSVLVLLSVWLLYKKLTGTLVIISYVTSISNFIVPAVASIILFRGSYSYVAPALSHIRFSVLKDILSLGVQFFVIQVAAIIIYSINNMLISHLFSPTEVTPFHISFKYFSVITMVFTIVITPFWSAITEARAINDIAWIKRVMKKLMKLCMLVSILAILMVLVAPWIYKLLVGSEIKIPYMLSVVMGAYVVVMAWNSIFSSYLNGVGKLKIQLISAIGGAVVYIPLAVLFASQFNMGITGIALTGLVLNVVSALWSPYQYYLLINNKAKGLWNR